MDICGSEIGLITSWVALGYSIFGQVLIETTFSPLTDALHESPCLSPLHSRQNVSSLLVQIFASLFSNQISRLNLTLLD